MDTFHFAGSGSVSDEIVLKNNIYMKKKSKGAVAHAALEKAREPGSQRPVHLKLPKHLKVARRTDP